MRRMKTKSSGELILAEGQLDLLIGFYLAGLLVSMSPTEEWRSKILEGVSKGEEKVAQPLKESMASLDGLSIIESSTQSGSTSGKPRFQTVLDNSIQLNCVSGPLTSSDWCNNQKLQDIALTSDCKGKWPTKIKAQVHQVSLNPLALLPPLIINILTKLSSLYKIIL
ncbi:hypothetical protein PPACK8108_LOCUS6978 [Phakopsora pachyrhizi]|uniref:Uncharacterized protein n=1 Tax=Phakopsora pachyrhizi TaxID=170000 RepID=A0AAV0ATS0_PHAPC|nr:hypothetical protein PPACK8108_LOCUS6978 [Phakopsora pachyrhizi]